MARTTIRIEKNLKKQVEKLAINEDMTLQEVVNRALYEYLEEKAKKRAEKIYFKFHRLGRQLDNLKREDFYPEPKMK